MCVEPDGVPYLKENITDGTPNERAPLCQLGIHSMCDILQVVTLSEIFTIEQQQQLLDEAGVKHVLLVGHGDVVIGYLHTRQGK